MNIEENKELYAASESNGHEAYDCGVSVSFRIYDSTGRTIQFHVFYR